MDVCNKAEFSAFVSERYPVHLRVIQRYEEDRAEWIEANSGWRPPESDESDQGPDWIPKPEAPHFYDSVEEYFDV